MKTAIKGKSKTLIYVIFFIYVIVLTTACTFAQDNAMAALAQIEKPAHFEEIKSLPNTPNNYCHVLLSEAFDYDNLKIEIHGDQGIVKHTYACYATSEAGFIIDFSNFAEGTYHISVTNGSKTYFQKMIIDK